MHVEAIDYETTGFDCYKGDRIFAFVLTDTNLNSKVYRFDNVSEAKNKRSEKVFRDFHFNPNIKKVAHNARFEMGFTKMHLGSLPESDWDDTMLMHQMLRNLVSSHKQEDLAKKYLSEAFKNECERWSEYDTLVKKSLTRQKYLLNNYPEKFQKEILDPLKLDSIKPFITNKANYGLVPRKIMNGYQIADGERCILLYILMLPKLKANIALYRDYLNEIKLLRTTQKMEERGMMLHLEEAKNLKKELLENLNKIEKDKIKLFGFNINFGSSDQIQKHLFGYYNPKKHDNLDAIWKRKKPRFNLEPVKYTSAGFPSADKQSMLDLVKKYPDNPALDMLLRFRAYSKGAAMIQGYIDMAGKDLIIHPNIHTNQAKTGRQSVSNPSLQNVSKEVGNTSIYGIPARRCFRPRPGYVYFLGDYAGIELRLIIAASGEEVLIERLNIDMDFDVHSFNAAIFYGEAWRMGSAEQRKKMRTNCKTAIFALAYGANIRVIGQALNLSASETRAALRRFEAQCPCIANFCTDKMNMVKSQGYITTAFGRRLDIFKDQAYTASNYQIQGDAAGILKRAENNTNEYIETVWGNNLDLLSLILVVHDEEIIEMHSSLLPQKEGILHDISYCMTNIKEIKVPLATEWKMATTNWHSAKGIEI